MTDVREAVARAICKSNNGDDDEWPIYKTDADAAISAHIEEIMWPSKDARDEGGQMFGDLFEEHGGGTAASKTYSNVAATRIWQAMLTAMRNEK